MEKILDGYGDYLSDHHTGLSPFNDFELNGKSILESVFEFKKIGPYLKDPNRHILSEDDIERFSDNKNNDEVNVQNTFQFKVFNPIRLNENDLGIFQCLLFDIRESDDINVLNLLIALLNRALLKLWSNQ